MNSWTSVKVGTIARQIRGVSYAKDDARTVPHENYIPLLRANNITESGLIFKDLVFVPLSCVSADQLLRTDDLVIAVSSGSLDVVGKAAALTKPFNGTFGAFCKALRPSTSVDSRYFAHFFKTPAYRAIISSCAAGANINNLRNRHLDDLDFPLPPLPEQRRIAAILDQADALRAKRQAALAQFDEMTQAIFVDMFGDAQNWPLRWDMRSFKASMTDETAQSAKIQKSEFSPQGRFPIIDQGQSDVAGYTDDDTMLCRAPLPCIVFGDHTRKVKLVRHPFVIGADGAKVLVPRPGMDATFLAHMLRHSDIPDLGYSRHMRELKRKSYSAPPLAR